jgi:hypothetical protein
MDVKKLNEIIQQLKKDLGDALLACDVWAAADGQPIVGLNPQPKASALMNRMILLTNEALKDAEFPLLNRYFLHHLEGEHIGMTNFIGDYNFGVLIDAQKAQLGLLLNVIIPKAVDAIKEALAA